MGGNKGMCCGHAARGLFACLPSQGTLAGWQGGSHLWLTPCQPWLFLVKHCWWALCVRWQEAALPAYYNIGQGAVASWHALLSYFFLIF